METGLIKKIASLLTALSTSALASGCITDFGRPAVQVKPAIKGRQSLSQQGRPIDDTFTSSRSSGGSRSGY